MKSIVVKFDTQRRLGFIRPEDSGRDVFVHLSQVQGRQELKVGQRVAFGVREVERGPSAYCVHHSLPAVALRDQPEVN